MRTIRKFLMWLFFNETCTCDRVSDENTDAGCYICSPHFRFLPHLFNFLNRVLDEE